MTGLTDAGQTESSSIEASEAQASEPLGIAFDRHHGDQKAWLRSDFVFAHPPTPSHSVLKRAPSPWDLARIRGCGPILVTFSPDNHA